MKDVYSLVGMLVGGVTFAVIWMLTFLEWGLLVGIMFGWIPALIAGVLAGLAWPVILFFTALTIWMMTIS